MAETDQDGGVDYYDYEWVCGGSVKQSLEGAYKTKTNEF